MALKFWMKDGALVVDGSGHPILCEHCPCEEDSVPLICCDSFEACIDEDTPIPEALFAAVRIRQGPGPGGTILSSFTIPINYSTTVNFGGATKSGWYGCEERDPEADCFEVAAVFLQCLSGEFRASFNGFIASGQTLCDGFIATTGQGASGSLDGTFGTSGLVASPFAISAEADYSRSDGFCGSVYIEMDFTE
jgi:hypothetical protein